MKCQHPPCTCRVEELGGFCSEACIAGGGTGVMCACGHPQCEGSERPAGGDFELT